MTDDQDVFQEDHLLKLPSILDQINIADINIDDENQELFMQPSFEGHDENLAEKLSESTLDKIAARLIDDIENDLISRKDWEDSLSEGLKQLGLKLDKRTFPFEGASGNYSPVLMHSIIQFYVTAVPELLPLEGPVKELIIGNVTEELEAQAKRIEMWANIYFTKDAPEFYSDFKKMLLWLGFVGDTVRKIYFDPILKRPTSQFIMPQDFIVKYGTTNLETCPRMTERKVISKMTLAEYQKMRIYRDIEISAEELDEESNFKKTLDYVEGMTTPNYEDNDEYTIYESHTHLDIEELSDDYNEEDLISSNYRPYIISIDKKSKKILGLYRNWDEGDKDFRRIDIYNNYSYLEGLGFYGNGATQIIGGLADASTKLLRQTIDGQTLSNFPGGLRSKGMRSVDNNLRIGPTEFIEIDTGGLPIQQAVMLMPYKEPSPYINELKKELEDKAAAMMGSANSQISELNPNVPVGTTYAMLGLFHKVQSTIIRGIRDSMTKEFNLFYKLFAKHLPDVEYKFDASGEESFIKADDFTDKISLISVADPHITSDIQRLMRSQTILENARMNPELHDLYQANKMFYESLKIPQSKINEILPPKEETPPLDPITENQNLIQGKAAVASIEQDHQSHMIVHGIILNDPASPPEIIASVMAHNASHMAFKMMLDMQQMMGIQLPENPYELPMEVQNQIAMMAANAIMNQQQQMQEKTPPPSLDPALVMLEEVKVKDKGIDEKAKADQLKAETEAFKAQLNYEAEMKKIELGEKELELKAQGII